MIKSQIYFAVFAAATISVVEMILVIQLVSEPTEAEFWKVVAVPVLGLALLWIRGQLIQATRKKMH